jgi:hypothetical protein
MLERLLNVDLWSACDTNSYMRKLKRKEDTHLIRYHVGHLIRCFLEDGQRNDIGEFFLENPNDPLSVTLPFVVSITS